MMSPQRSARRAHRQRPLHPAVAQPLVGGRELPPRPDLQHAGARPLPHRPDGELVHDNGGLSWSAGRSATSAETLYGWAEASDAAEPFVRIESQRSKVVATIDFDESIDADTLDDVLRANGIVDVTGSRKLGRNQLRIGMFPAIDPADTEALTACLDYCIQAMS